MARSNRPLTSREFKIMLDTNHFKDREKGIHEISAIVERLIEGQGGKFEAHNKDNQEERTTWFLDTNACGLYCINKFLLRIRKEKESGMYDVTLKCRHPDRYVSALHDLSKPEGEEMRVENDFKIKFEEDIMTDKMTDGRITSISKFSLSASLEGNQIPDFKTVKGLVSVFPNLELGGIDANEPLFTVNNFKAIEISSKIGTMTFSNDETDVDAELNIWYLSAEDEKPLIVEFTFKYKATKEDKDKDKDKNKEMLLEKYPRNLVLGASKFYESLQRDKIVDLDTTRTKTDFVYQKRCKS